MALDPVTAVLDIGGKIIDKFWPDPATANAAKLEMYKAQQEGALAELTESTKLALAQIEVNKADAQSGSFWQSGWRPQIGWICGWGLGYQFLVYPMLVAVYPKIVQLDMGTLLTLLGGLLGLGAMRTTEKLQGKA
jgi:Holin of 3TMs, for gene-transfer release